MIYTLPLLLGNINSFFSYFIKLLYVYFVNSVSGTSLQCISIIYIHSIMISFILHISFEVVAQLAGVTKLALKLVRAWSKGLIPKLTYQEEGLEWAFLDGPGRMIRVCNSIPYTKMSSHMRPLPKT